MTDRGAPETEGRPGDGAFYGTASRRLQARFGTEALAERLERTIVVDALGPDDRAFIESRDFFFLSTVSEDGFPSVSHKGGRPGVVAVLDDRTLAFPGYDGNGMYLSIGNLVDTARIGLLFIDFEEPARLRVRATARLADDPDLLARWPGAELVVVATIDRAWINCPRYIHRHVRVADATDVPDGDGRAPLADWKRIDFVNDVLPEATRAEVEAAGGPISPERYAEEVSARRSVDAPTADGASPPAGGPGPTAGDGTGAGPADPSG